MPLNPNIQFANNILDKTKVEQKPIREGFGIGLRKAGEVDPNVVALCADLTESTRVILFKEKFPDRFVEMGVAEQNMASVAAGMALMGKIPFITSYAMFSPGRNWEQIRTTICYNEANVKIAGSHAGVSVGPDGATHQAIEDIAIMRPIANMTVLVPCDMHEAEKATLAAAAMQGPVYIRLAREKTSILTTPDTLFEIGKAQTFWVEPAGTSPDVTLIACGSLVHNALLAAQELESEGIKVRLINNVSVKPMDVETIIAGAKDAGAVVTIEEHQVAGGMGSAVAEILAKNCPVPIEFIGVQNSFGQSGEPNELVEYFGMGVNHIIEAAKKVIQRK